MHHVSTLLALFPQPTMSPSVPAWACTSDRGCWGTLACGGPPISNPGSGRRSRSGSCVSMVGSPPASASVLRVRVRLCNIGVHKSNTRGCMHVHHASSGPAQGSSRRRRGGRGHGWQGSTSAFTLVPLPSPLHYTGRAATRSPHVQPPPPTASALSAAASAAAGRLQERPRPQHPLGPPRPPSPPSFRAPAPLPRPPAGAGGGGGAQGEDDTWRQRGGVQ